jgi:hypothetical protein
MELQDVLRQILDTGTGQSGVRYTPRAQLVSREEATALRDEYASIGMEAADRAHRMLHQTKLNTAVFVGLVEIAPEDGTTNLMLFTKQLSGYYVASIGAVTCLPTPLHEFTQDMRSLRLQWREDDAALANEAISGPDDTQ